MTAHPLKPILTTPPGVVSTEGHANMATPANVAVMRSAMQRGRPVTVWADRREHAIAVRAHLFDSCDCVTAPDSHTHVYRGVDSTDRPWCVEVYDHEGGAE